MASTTTADHGHDHAHGDHAHGDGHGHGPSFLAHHFDNLDQQFESAKLGMWVFLVTEILMFGGLFAAFIYFQGVRPEVFIEAHHHLNKIQGGTNTIFLLTSSLTIALAVRSSQLNKRNQTTLLLLATLAFAGGFLVIKYFEYTHKIHDGLLPGPAFCNPQTVHLAADAACKAMPKDAHVFFSLYFMMTGLHGVHVVIGMGLISWVLLRNMRGDFNAQFFTPVEIVGLYWHLVDLIWIYLFPLLYLIT